MHFTFAVSMVPFSTYLGTLPYITVRVCVRMCTLRSVPFILSVTRTYCCCCAEQCFLLFLRADMESRFHYMYIHT